MAFLSRLLEAGVDVRFADLPAIEGPTGRFILQQMAAVAELEAGMISKRTKDALAAAKARGKKLGGYRGARLSKAARAAGRAAVASKARQRAADLAPVITELQSAGVTSLRAIAAVLNARSIPTATGRGSVVCSPSQPHNDLFVVGSSQIKKACLRMLSGRPPPVPPCLPAPIEVPVLRLGPHATEIVLRIATGNPGV